MSAGRIDRSDFPSITVQEWAAVEDYNGALVYQEIPAIYKKDGDGKVTTTVEIEAVPPTDRGILVTVDAIINGITNGYYQGGIDGDEKPGEVTKAYFAGAAKAIEAMEVVCGNMGMYLTAAIAPSFEFGTYSSYDSLMAALRRYYGEDECQETMIDIIKKIVTIVKKDQRMEQKVAEFRELAHRLMIVEKSKWIRPRDFTDDRTAYMEAGENYGPMLNTMFTAMVFSHTIPQNRWASIQSLFNARTTDISYRGWHLNRPELYKILDLEKKSTGAISGVDTSTDTIGYAGRSGWSNRNQKNKPKKTSNPNKKSKNSKVSKEKGRTGNRTGSTVDRMCRHCTQKAGRPMYHDAPYGGGKNCKPKKNKNKRSRAIHAVQDEDKAGGGDAPTASDDGEDESNSNSSEYSSDSDVGALDEEYFPSFGGGYGAQI